MHSTSYASLCERIRNHCQQKRWYGPDIYYNSRVFNQFRGGPWILHDFRTSFFPVATEEHIRLSEEVMGLSYPSLLRTLYLQVANGGFGPAYGLPGAFCGYLDAMRKEKDHKYVIQESIVYPHFQEEVFVDLEQYEEQNGDPKRIDIGEYSWPSVWSKFFIFLCGWGCGRSSFLHAQNGRVYYQDEGWLIRQADSLEEWLDRWLQGEDLEQVAWLCFD